MQKTVYKDQKRPKKQIIIEPGTERETDGRTDNATDKITENTATEAIENDWWTHQRVGRQKREMDENKWMEIPTKIEMTNMKNKSKWQWKYVIFLVALAKSWVYGH